jgi:hypothetical protein
MLVLRRCGWCALCILAGCSSGPALTTISGTVTLDNVPLAGAVVRFIPQGNTQGHGGIGKTNADGKYEITAIRLNRKGLQTGEYKVVVTRVTLPDGKPLPPNVGPADTAHVENVPEPYCKLDQTPLNVTVAAEAVMFDIPMKK